MSQQIDKLQMNETSEEMEIDLSGAQWDVEGLEEPDPETKTQEGQNGHYRRHFFKR